MPTVAGVGAPPDPADALLLPVELWLSCSRLLPHRGTKCEAPWLPLPSAPPLSKIANEIGNVKAFVFFVIVNGCILGPGIEGLSFYLLIGLFLDTFLANQFNY